MRPPRPTALALVMLALLLLPALAGAHTDAAQTQPGEGAVLVSPPDRVVVTFAAPVARVAPAGITVDGAGDVAGETRIDPDDARRVLIDVDPAQTRGRGGVYRAMWTITALDGHRQDGAVSFRVRGAESTPGALPAGPAGRLVGAAAFVQPRGR